MWPFRKRRADEPIHEAVRQRLLDIAIASEEVTALLDALPEGAPAVGVSDVLMDRAVVSMARVNRMISAGTMVGNPVPNIPAEMLERIMEFVLERRRACEFLAGGVASEEHMFPRSCSSRGQLRDLRRVCREWRDVASPLVRCLRIPNSRHLVCDHGPDRIPCFREMADAFPRVSRVHIEFMPKKYAASSALSSLLAYYKKTRDGDMPTVVYFPSRPSVSIPYKVDAHGARVFVQYDMPSVLFHSAQYDYNTVHDGQGVLTAVPFVHEFPGERLMRDYMGVCASAACRALGGDLPTALEVSCIEYTLNRAQLSGLRFCAPAIWILCYHDGPCDPSSLRSLLYPKNWRNGKLPQVWFQANQEYAPIHDLRRWRKLAIEIVGEDNVRTGNICVW